VAVDPQTTTNDMQLMIRTVIAGGGITFGMEDTFRPFVSSGQPVPLPAAYCPPFAGFVPYFPNRRKLAPKLRALADHVRRAQAAP
jgi:DNA-binding transcriptional LysR family regulator